MTQPDFSTNNRTRLTVDIGDTIYLSSGKHIVKSGRWMGNFKWILEVDPKRWTTQATCIC
jgi:hypothetical protein